MAREATYAAKDSLLVALQRANYLAAMLPVDKKQPVEFTPGQSILKQGTRIGVLSASKDGKNYPLLFSDWKSLKAYTDLQVTGRVLPAMRRGLSRCRGTHTQVF